MIIMENKPVEWLTVEEVANELRVPETSVRDWLRTRKLASYKFGKRLKIRRSDLEQFIESSKQ